MQKTFTQSLWMFIIPEYFVVYWYYYSVSLLVRLWWPACLFWLPVSWLRYCFRAISFFVSLSATLRENGWTDLHDIFREGVEWPWDDLTKFWVNSGKRVGGSKVNLLSPAIAQSQLHSLGGSRGRGLLCPAPQLVVFSIRIICFIFHLHEQINLLLLMPAV